MHQLYLHRCDENGWPRVPESTYRKVFCEDFNLAFGCPRTDTCKTCDELKIKLADASTDEERESLTALKTQHQQMAEDAYERLRQDTQLAQAESHTLVISFDMQQNLPTPLIHTSLVYYLRKLWAFNLGIHNCGTNDGYMCMWPENTAKRGSD